MLPPVIGKDEIEVSACNPVAVISLFKLRFFWVAGVIIETRSVSRGILYAMASSVR
ncbi:hypothetical protein DDI_3760 [Dickeya dianthicola RNS04.9]|nr:hypothetical protein DDI_3760 [Dickeya dianthicola RNS04.9]